MMTVETAPIDKPILVWVADIAPATGRPVGWRMGKCWDWKGTEPQLYAEGFNGKWDIPFWHPLPDDPK